MIDGHRDFIISKMFAYELTWSKLFHADTQILDEKGDQIWLVCFCSNELKKKDKNERMDKHCKNR
jgi:hypothetical protein